MYQSIPHRFVSAVIASGIMLAVLFSSYRISAASEVAAVSGGPVPAIGSDVVGTAGTFFDISEDDWFYGDVMLLSEKKIINGYPDGGFHPERNITKAEFIKMLVVAVGAEVDSAIDKPATDEHWASEYIALAHSVGILTDSDIAHGLIPDAPMKRSDMAKMVSGALHIQPIEDIKPFADSDDPYSAALYKEYVFRGIPGADGNRYNYDNAETKRSEAAAIAARVMSYRDGAEEYKKNVILENASQYELRHEFELEDLFRVLNREFISDFIIKTPYQYSEWIEIYKRANIRYLEDFYASYLNCEYSKNSNTYKLYLDYELDRGTLSAYRREAEAAADKGVSAVISDNMSDTEKIRAIHDYLVLNCSYDYQNYSDGTITYDSRLAYGALCKKSAVCQGYTAAFNMMARRAGIQTEVVTGKAPGNDDTHVWNRVIVDGTAYYVDVTHDDPVPDQLGRVSYKYFMLSEDEMLVLGYLWDR